MRVRAIGGFRVAASALLATALLAWMAGAALALAEEAPRKAGKVEGSWEVTLRLAESIPVGEQTSEEFPGWTAAVGIGDHLSNIDEALWPEPVLLLAVEPRNNLGL